MLRLFLLAVTVATSCPSVPHGDPPEFGCSPDVVRESGGGYARCEWIWRCSMAGRTYHWFPDGRPTFNQQCLEVSR